MLFKNPGMTNVTVLILAVCAGILGIMIVFRSIGMIIAVLPRRQPGSFRCGTIWAWVAEC